MLSLYMVNQAVGFGSSTMDTSEPASGWSTKSLVVFRSQFQPAFKIQPVLYIHFNVMSPSPSVYFKWSL
jgi:hypothetical protein